MVTDLETTWLERSREKADAFWLAIEAHSARLRDPRNQRRLWQLLCFVALVWMVVGLAELVWSLFPAPAAQAPPENIINPLTEPARQSQRGIVDIEVLASWPLFGTVDTPSLQSVAEAADETEFTDDLRGVGDDAEETRLPLLLAGVVYSSDPSRARAVIEAKKEQAQYAIGDELPVGNKVTVARILADRVILKNDGEYELLRLFDDDGRIVSRANNEAADEEKAESAQRRALEQRNKRILQMAEAHRRGVVAPPTSLADVVNIAEAREGGQLLGYRVSAARDSAQFQAMGFRDDDVITAVNGVAVTDPGKAIELFRIMRSSSEARLDVLRDGQAVTLMVGLDNSLGQ